MLRAKVFISSLLILMAACKASRPSAFLVSENDPSIVGGEEAKITDPISKSTVAILESGKGIVCTGTLVATNLILTAAHCVSGLHPSKLRVSFGPDVSSFQAPTVKVVGGRITEKWINPTPETETNWGDIALIRIETDAPAGYTPVRLLSDSRHLSNGMEVTIAGFGVLQMNPYTETKKLHKATVLLTKKEFSLTEFLIDFQSGKTVCHGDSGGPVYVQINGKLFVIGVTSRTIIPIGSATCREGGVYTSVPAHVDFLSESAKSLQSKDFKPNEIIPAQKDPI